ncbi:LacI family DNA-binding transcriptional regulator [Fodinisporobacter ferrooxydans]|uniref:LacI family DNA-binding transcriptional regulator n=1 Tax=Fodinisporobacter ferrooxydans TaxID=2901836 RepID=A0ABY4CLI0_9BACL|nr:LacI family DNA-binding transcriptional regulator [Alicyclobacillaceae bacterium MYW30-H2]
MATIKDVATKAGVTVTTVSRVFNNRGYISDATRKKVLQAMEELNYRPNELARSFYKNRSNIIGLIVPTVSNPFFGQLATCIENFAYDNKYKILICNSNLDQAKEKEYVEMLKSNKVDGIIMGSHTLDVEEFKNLDYPIVTFDRKIYDFPFIRSDNYKGGELATELLIQKGCKKLAHICNNLELNMLGNKRTEAFVDVAGKYGVQTVMIETDTIGFNRQGNDLAIQNMFEKHPDIDGVFVSSDFIAYSVMNICTMSGRKIPDDVKLVGYDDIFLGSLVKPYLTTIHQPIETMAQCAVQTIFNQIEGIRPNVDNTFPVHLVERETT